MIKEKIENEYSKLSKTISSMLEMTTFIIDGYPKPYGFKLNLVLPKEFKLVGYLTFAKNSRVFELQFLKQKDLGNEPEVFRCELIKKVKEERR